MKIAHYIPLDHLCSCYHVEMSFFSNLEEIGLIEINYKDETCFVHEDCIDDIEKMIRLYHDLNINAEGIDVVFNLLKHIDDLQLELVSLKNRLRMYENRKETIEK